MRNITQVYMPITSGCILKCPGCPTGRRNFISQEKIEFMDIKIFRSVVSKIYRICGSTYFFLHTWNEPLVHPQMIALMDILCEYNHTCYISSNLNLHFDWEKLLSHNSLKTFVLSISGCHQEVYARGHRGGNVELVLKNIEEIAKYVPKSSARVVMAFHKYKDNAFDGQILEEICAQSGIEFLPHEGTILQNHVENNVLAERVIWRDDKDVMENVYPRIFSEPFIFHNVSGLEAVECNAQRYLLTIDHRGNLLTCCDPDVNTEITIGNFLELTEDEIFAKKLDFSFCKRCQKLGLHVQFPFASFMDKATSNKQIIDFLQKRLPHELYARKRIYMFGVNQFSGLIAQLLRLQGYSVAGLIDEDPKKQNSTLHGFTVYSLESVWDDLPGSVVIDVVRVMQMPLRLSGTRIERSVEVLSAEQFIRNICSASA